MSRKQKPIEQLMAALDRCELLRIDYAIRTGPGDAEAWQRYEVAESAFRRLALKLLREAAASPKKRRGAP